MRAPKRVRSKIVGVSFVHLDGCAGDCGSAGCAYPENVYALERMTFDRSIADGEYAEPIPAVLIRNADNEHDGNAVEVHVPSVGMLGHLRRVEASVLAPHIDAGVTYQGEIVHVLVHREHPDRPGIDIRMTRIDREVCPR